MGDESGMTPLMHSTITNKLTVVTLLIEHRADLHVQDCNGATATHYAVQFRHIHALQELLNVEGGKETLIIKDARRLTPIDYARTKEREQCMQLLAHSLGDRHRVALKHGVPRMTMHPA